VRLSATSTTESSDLHYLQKNSVIVCKVNMYILFIKKLGKVEN